MTIEQGGPITTSPFELSSVDKKLSYPITVTVFAETHIQSFQLAGVLQDIILKDEIVYYDYDQSFSVPVASGTLVVNEYKCIPVQFADTPNKALRWGSDIMFTLHKIIN